MKFNCVKNNPPIDTLIAKAKTVPIIIANASLKEKRKTGKNGKRNK